MNELIKIQSDGRISAKDLYGFLTENKSNFSHWVKSNIELNNFAVANKDYIAIRSYDETPTGGKIERKDYLLTIEFAKELCMLSKCEKGKQARDYFIEIERRYKKSQEHFQIPQTYAEALQLAANQAKQIEQDRPKVLFADSVSLSKTNILIGELAKLIKQNGHDIGQNRLFEWLRKNKYLISRQGTDYNMPTQKAMNMGLFAIKETSITHSDGHVTVNKTTKVTGKGQIYFVNKFIAA